MFIYKPVRQGLVINTPQRGVYDKPTSWGIYVNRFIHRPHCDGFIINPLQLNFNINPVTKGFYINGCMGAYMQITLVAVYHKRIKSGYEQ